ncbi:7466_t:CDS:10 [Acaulospora morrowiae]|uniref:7466_t:CDS:1 n=1 Tax=Acaulospora morrowiae TaxID=94023 RepID=A0A9N8VMZ1_9GLOM|nr:7466_t:CDS:10 [Acaulospora morrowiae]
MSGRTIGSRGNRGGRGQQRSQNLGERHPHPQRQNRAVSPSRLEEVRNEQIQAISSCFNSSELSYNGSDAVISILHSEPYKRTWRRLIKNEFIHQHQMRRFITSCIIDAKKVGYELEELVKELGSSNGIDRIREIVAYPVSVDAGSRPKVASFQRVTLPLLALLTRSGIIECNLDKKINSIYLVVYNNLDSFVNKVVMSNLQVLVERRDVSDHQKNQNALLADDPDAFIPTSLGQFFLVIVRLINEFLRRIKSSSFDETIHQIAEKIERLKNEWHESLDQQVNASDPLANDTKCRDYFFLILDKDIERMKNMLKKTVDKTPKVSSNSDISRFRNVSRLVDLKRIYDPPGELSPDGMRHDNDFSEITKISIIPTKEETLCGREPFLPVIDEDDNLHHLPKGVARLLDRQFRLLREDMLNAFRLSIKSFISFLREAGKNDEKLITQGGRYKHQGDGNLNVYTNVKLSEIVIDMQKGFACRVTFTPPNNKKSFKEREAYWRKANRLMSGNMVCLLWPNEDNYNEKKDISATDYSIYFGIVANRDEKMLAKDSGIAKVDITFIDVSIYSMAMKEISSQHTSNRTVKQRFMVESTDLLFESYKNTLKTLQEAQPEDFPFAMYFATKMEGDMSNIVANVDPPIYSRAPGFKFDLSVLLGGSVNRRLLLDVRNRRSENDAIEDLKARTTLDETQAQALVSALSREVALIEGPPGTGKTFIGVQIMRVLLANRKSSKIGPILTITYTNHALDSFLLSLLEHKIDNIVRMGSRSKSDVIMEFQIDAICRRRNDKSRKMLLGRTYRELKQVEKEAKKFTENQKLRWINWNHPLVASYLMDNFYEHYRNLMILPRVLNNRTSRKETGTSNNKVEGVEDNMQDSGTEDMEDSETEDMEDSETEDIEDNRINNETKDVADNSLNNGTEDMEGSETEDIEDSRINNETKGVVDSPLNNRTEDVEENLLNEDTNDSQDEWQTVGDKKRKTSNFEQWIQGVDLRRAKKLKESMNKPKKRSVKVKNIYEALSGASDGSNVDNSDNTVDHGFYNWLDSWKMPQRERSLEELKVDCDVWNMSKKERVILHDFWREEIYSESIEELERIRNEYDQLKSEFDKIRNEERRDIITKCDVIGITTSGAAKYHELIRSIGPKVVICEEAGEVLEAHILSSLTPSVQHIILIGDHNQLRPKICDYLIPFPFTLTLSYFLLFWLTLNIYGLSVESNAGKSYGLDISLFERLVHGRNSCMKVEATQLLTQRRMRREIADLVRETIYPSLEDHERTLYPDVRGVQSNVFFIDHRNPEDSTKSEFALQSHSNKYEVQMVVEMVKYFVRNGYSKAEQIAVLTPYLGQMIKIRDALSSSFMVVIDERDSEALANFQDQLEDNEPLTVSTASKKRLTQQVVLRTVDNFQGEEADIVIISLVRNTINQDDRGSIGFLKSKNRTNVLLSRARHGMYLLGNARLMKNESKMWADVIEILESRQPSQVGPGLPIVCAQHPDYKNIISNPQEFAEVSPDGGCMLNCGMILDCGHICKYFPLFFEQEVQELQNLMTIPIYSHYVAISQLSARSHVSDCVIAVILANLHVERNAGNAIFELCHESTDNMKCHELCGFLLSECGHSCKSECWECQKESIKVNNGTPQIDENENVRRTNHKGCKQKCSRNQFCVVMKRAIRTILALDVRMCVMFLASTQSAKPSAAYLARCVRSGAIGRVNTKANATFHAACLVQDYHVISIAKSFLSVDTNGDFGICGEVCPSSKFCVECAPENVKSQVVDLIMQTTFAETDWNTELMVVLECDHVFTAETLDGFLEMNEFYQGDDLGNWLNIKPIVDQPGELKYCPNCRKLIKNVYRYGRVIKKRILDTQNRKFLMHYDSRLKIIENDLEKVTNRLENNRKEIIVKLNDIHLTQAGQVSVKSNVKIIDNTQLDITPRERFERLEHYYSIPSYHERLWSRHVKSLLYYYKEVYFLMSRIINPPHKLAYDAAVSSLFKKKSEVQMDKLIEDMRSLNIMLDDSVDTQNRRLQESLKEVGITTPKIDRRIYLDALFMMLNIRKALFHEVSSIISGLTRTTLPNYKDEWLKFSKFLIKSTKSHLELIKKTASETQYKRHLVTALLGSVEFKCAVGRFELRNPPSGVMNLLMKKRIMDKCQKIEQRCLPIRDLLREINLEHFVQQCNVRVDEVIKDARELYIAAENSGELSREEKLMIHNAMSGEFHGSGHWYQCPNGHVYTIGECGMAMQSSRCPECGTAIGGGEHRFIAGNVRNEEFDNMQ